MSFSQCTKKLWWFHADASCTVSEAESVRVPCGKLPVGKWKFSKTAGTKCEEAGTELFYQHHGARPHTARQNARSFSTYSKVKGFKITVAVQPLQSPDVNVDDLAFFRSLQTDAELVAKVNRRDLWLRCSAVGRSTQKKKESVWHCLYSSYKGILEDSGGYDYQRSRGSCAAHIRGFFFFFFFLY